jgi:type II secretory pathway pseudopilin PulG
MRTQIHSGGFTIIEVMLFLAITGALTVGILVGSGAAIGQQRYRDSVNSFKGLIQEQYSQIANVVNSEAEKPVCTRTGNNLAFNSEISQARGTSECLIVGRFILINATEVTVYNVVGQPGAGTPSGGDTAVLGEYALDIQSPEVHEVSWRARIVEPKSTNDSLSSILIVRSPVSGAVLTYVQDGDHTATISEMISNTNMVEKNFCVDSGGGSAMANRLAVRINAMAANQSAVEIPLEEDGVCD